MSLREITNIAFKILLMSPILTDAKALSKVASALGLQENIRFKLSEKKDDMRRQNDRIQNEIDGNLLNFYTGIISLGVVLR